MTTATRERLTAGEIDLAAKRSGYSAGYVRAVLREGTDQIGTARRIALAAGIALESLLYGRGTDTQAFDESTTTRRPVAAGRRNTRTKRGKDNHANANR